MNSPSPPLTCRSWTSTLMWGRLLFVCHLSRRILSLKASHHVFCLWMFAIGSASHLPSHEALLLLEVLLRPCSFHPHVSFLIGTRTLVCHHQKAKLLWLPTDAIQNLMSLYCQVLFSPHSGHKTYFQVYACHIVDKPPPTLTPTPVLYSGGHSYLLECSFASGVSEV